MKTILINRQIKNGSWGGGNNFVKSFVQYFSLMGHNVVYDFNDIQNTPIDILFVQDPRPCPELSISINDIVYYKQKYNINAKIIHRVNECSKRKNDSSIDPLLVESSKFTNTTIFVSNWMKQHHINKEWYCKDTHVAYNGVSRGIYTPSNKKLSNSNSKINLVTHHWSNNYLKGFDVYEKVDKFVAQHTDFTFTYIGRHNNTFNNTKIIPPISGKKLGHELSKYDVYISGSRFDPGPNHILESLSCNLPTFVHKDGGGAVEFAGKENVYNNIDELFNILLSKKFKKNKTNVLSWFKCMENIGKIIL